MRTGTNANKSGRLTAEERREQILEAALEVFAAKGFSGARTREIAKRAGISETLIFRHFDNKEELYRAGIKHLYEDHPVAEDILPSMGKKDDLGVFTGLAQHMLRHTRKDPRIIRLHLFRLLDGKGDHKGHTGHKMATDAELAVYIRARVEDGAFAPCDPLFMAKLFHYTVFMAVIDRQLQVLDTPLDMDDEAMAENLAQWFLDGLRAR